MQLYFNSNIFIHAFECETDLGHAARRAFALIDDGAATGITSELTLAEVLPRPYREKNALLELAYEETFAGRKGFEICPISLTVLRVAARLNAESGLRLPDALHVATALEASCDAFVTEDRRLQTPAPLVIRRLSDELFA